MGHILDFVNRVTPKALQPLQSKVYWKLKNIEPDVRAWRTWRGQEPRIYLHNNHPHPVFETYDTHPAMTYAPYAMSGLCHWVDGLPPRRSPRKDHIYEIEHLMVLNKPDNKNFMLDWYRVHEDLDFIRGLIAADNCPRIFTFSQGLVEHFKTFLPADLWPKMDYAYPAFPAQPEYEKTADRPFTILTIASRFIDKGVPEALNILRILHEKHGDAVKMVLVCSTVPEGYEIPAGVEHINVRWLSPELKRDLYQNSDVLLLPCYSETAACFTEAYAFGIPVVTTRIHHGDEYVREGETGYLLEAPLWMYTEGFGKQWKTGWEFLDDVERRRERGDMKTLIEQAVHYLETMLANRAQLPAMQSAARRFHAERFSPEARNGRLLNIYAEALHRKADKAQLEQLAQVQGAHGEAVGESS